MMRKAWPVLAVILLAAPGRVAAADKTHQQIMAEIRMLQEQQQQLQQALRGLNETLKTLATKIDDQAGVARKSFADQKLIVDNVAEGVRILREKADDTNVRLSSMTQELQTMRQAIASIPAPAPIVPTGEPGDPGVTPPTGTAPATGTPAPPINISHQRVYDLSYNDYMGGQFELAITGFESYIRTYPTSPLADDAQLNIGNAYYGWGKYKEAVDALQKVIRDYPKSDSVAAAYYKLGQAYSQLNMIEPARKAYETVVQNYPDSIEYSLARQALERFKRKE